MKDLAEEVGDTRQLALIELDGAKAFTARTTDPKSRSAWAAPTPTWSANSSTQRVP